MKVRKSEKVKVCKVQMFESLALNNKVERIFRKEHVEHTSNKNVEQKDQVLVGRHMTAPIQNRL